MDTNERYLRNADTVREMGEQLGFTLHSFDPNWRIMYDKYVDRTNVHDVSDEMMEIIAKSLGLPWENEYKSHLNALTLHRAQKEKDREEIEYNHVWLICEVYIKSEMRLKELHEKCERYAEAEHLRSKRNKV